MAGNFTFHNKFHRANHHSLSSFDILDSGFDPIASQRHPFLGVFYNRLTDNERTYSIDTDSYQWWSAYTTVGTFSANWMLTLPVYTTVNTLSDNWNLGYNSYLNLRANSGSWMSVYTTVCAYSAEWGSPYLMFTNKVQEYTHAKTFSGQNLKTVGLGLSSYDWNLDYQQVAFATITGDCFFYNPVEGTAINGGIYTLVIKQAGRYEVTFDSLYRFNDRPRLNDIVNRSLSGITVINFIAINDLLYGDVTFLSGNY